MPGDSSLPVDSPAGMYTAAAAARTRPRNASDRLQSPVMLREVIAVVSLIVLCDVAIYRGAGFAGLALPLAMAVGREEAGWTAYQLSDRELRAQLDARREQWAPYLDHGRREQALADFDVYVHQRY